ncbi:MAG: formimidoylglutamase [Sphingobacteriaceae bacterium]|nr:formimidoylglutamase [Sphingobacteriaceae bacterium]
MLDSLLSPLDNSQFFETASYPMNTFGAKVNKHLQAFPSLEGVKMAIVGVLESRQQPENPGAAHGADFIRQEFYRLYCMENDCEIVDLGNIKAGHTVQDTHVALREVCWSLIKQQVVPIVLGGSRDMAYGQYLAYAQYDSTIDLAAIDARFHLKDEGEESATNANNFLFKIIAHQPSHLFNYVNLGYQSYLVDREEVRLLEKLFFDAVRLGEVRANLEEAEPYLRAADMLYIDIAAVRKADAPGNPLGSPNGLFAHELCQLTRYAGLSDKLSSIGFYEYDPGSDRQLVTAATLAQAIWYFIDGYANRMNDLPKVKNRTFIKYTTTLKAGKHDLVFYKSKKSGRWWMEVTLPPIKGSKKERTHLVPCSYNDYLMAGKDELPDKWWKFHQKYMV